MTATVQTKITTKEFAKLQEPKMSMELIDGQIVRMPSRKARHQRFSAEIFLLLNNLIDSGHLFFAPLDVHLDKHNIVQPDIFWVSGPNSKCQLGKGDYWYGAPDLVVEILANETAIWDRREKFQLYQKHGTREYWLVNTAEFYVEVFPLVRGSFKRGGVYGPNDSFESKALGGKIVQLRGISEAPSA